MIVCDAITFLYLLKKYNKKLFKEMFLNHVQTTSLHRKSVPLSALWDPCLFCSDAAAHKGNRRHEEHVN